MDVREMWRKGSTPFTGRRMETKGNSEASVGDGGGRLTGGFLYFRLLDLFNG